MYYPRDLDEYSTNELKKELKRRKVLTKQGVCYYCKRSVQDTPCKFHKLHILITIKQ